MRLVVSRLRKEAERGRLTSKTMRELEEHGFFSNNVRKENMLRSPSRRQMSTVRNNKAHGIESNILTHQPLYSMSQLKQVLEGVALFYEKFGHVNISRYFVIPSSSSWPQRLHGTQMSLLPSQRLVITFPIVGVPLGLQLTDFRGNASRFNSHSSTAARPSALDIGNARGPREVAFDWIFEALLAFSKLNGHLRIPIGKRNIDVLRPASM